MPFPDPESLDRRGDVVDPDDPGPERWPSARAEATEGIGLVFDLPSTGQLAEESLTRGPHQQRGSRSR